MMKKVSLTITALGVAATLLLSGCSASGDETESKPTTQSKESTAKATPEAQEGEFSDVLEALECSTGMAEWLKTGDPSSEEFASTVVFLEACLEMVAEEVSSVPAVPPSTPDAYAEYASSVSIIADGYQNGEISSTEWTGYLDLIIDTDESLVTLIELQS